MDVWPKTRPKFLRNQANPLMSKSAPGREEATRAAVLAYWQPKNRITSPSPLMEKPARLESLGATERIHDHRVSP